MQYSVWVKSYTKRCPYAAGSDSPGSEYNSVGEHIPSTTETFWMNPSTPPYCKPILNILECSSLYYGSIHIKQIHTVNTV